MNNMIQEFFKFKQRYDAMGGNMIPNFRGGPQEQVQQLLNMGIVSQEKYNQAVQEANQLQAMLNLNGRR